jgi:hypothetical protein
MNLRLAGVTLRLHRFEIIAAVVAALAVGIGAAAILVQIDGVALPQGCRSWLGRGMGDAPAECAPSFRRLVDIIILQGQELFRIMGLLPFAVGILVGVPIVGRELEAGTTHTAWSLDGSRSRWLGRRIWPVATVIAAVMVLVAILTDAVAAKDQAIGGSAMTILGLHGIPALARVLAAFGIGLLVGSMVGRTLPGLVISGLVCGLVFLSVGQAQSVWIAAQEPSARAVDETRRWTFNGQWRWLDPDGRVLSPEELSAIVPDELEQADVGLIQPFYSAEWLEPRGYRFVAMGIPESEAVSGWTGFEIILYAVAGIVAAGSAFVVVRRRAP